MTMGGGVGGDSETCVFYSRRSFFRLFTKREQKWKIHNNRLPLRQRRRVRAPVWYIFLTTPTPHLMGMMDSVGARFEICRTFPPLQIADTTLEPVEFPL